MIFGINNPVLTAADPAADDAYGYCASLAKNGTMLAIGSEGWEGTVTDQGAVYFYDWQGDFWKQRTVLKAADAGAGDFFGRAVSLTEDGLTCVVGAHQWEGTLADQGGVYTYDWNGSSWVQRGAVLTAPDAAASDLFGQSASVSADGNVLAVGALSWEGTVTDQGCVYIFDKVGSAWAFRVQITAPGASAGDGFGRAVSLNENGTILVVGADYKTNTYTAQGAVYTFDISGATVTHRNTIYAPDAKIDDRFGCSVAISQDGALLFVGAEKWDGIYADQGRGYLFDENSGWVARDFTLTAKDAAVGDRFSKCAAFSKNKDVLIVGAHQWEGGATNQGAAYMFFL